MSTKFKDIRPLLNTYYLVDYDDFYIIGNGKYEKLSMFEKDFIDECEVVSIKNVAGDICVVLDYNKDIALLKDIITLFSNISIKVYTVINGEDKELFSLSSKGDLNYDFVDYLSQDDKTKKCEYIKKEYFERVVRGITVCKDDYTDMNYVKIIIDYIIDSNKEKN